MAVLVADLEANRQVLKGTLGKDKERLLQEIDLAIEHPDEAQLRPEWIRPF